VSKCHAVERPHLGVQNADGTALRPAKVDLFGSHGSLTAKLAMANNPPSVETTAIECRATEAVARPNLVVGEINQSASGPAFASPIVSYPMSVLYMSPHTWGTGQGFAYCSGAPHC
jgi:hypothetical protein